jgi:hypothetical protein
MGTPKTGPVPPRSRTSQGSRRSRPVDSMRSL